MKGTVSLLLAACLAFGVAVFSSCGEKTDASNLSNAASDEEKAVEVTLIGEPEIIMQNPYSRHNYFAWPTVTRLQNGKIAVVASGYRLKHVCPFGKTVISYSEDDGKTYTAPAPVFDTPLDDRDGGIMTFGDKGVIVTAFNNRELQKEYLKSEWLKATSYWIKDMEQIDTYIEAYLDIITDEDEEKYLGSLYRVSNDCGVTFGPVYKVPVSSPHGPCELPDGTILYVGTVFEYAAKAPENLIEAYAITTDGKSEFRGRIEPIYVDGHRMYSYEPHAFVLEDGTIICHIRVENATKEVQKTFTIYQSVSTDGGTTWSKPERILGTLGGAPAHIMQHSSGMLISTVSYRTAPYGIKAMFSRDNGKTWETGYDIYVNGVSSDLGYPSTVELSDGSLITVFYAHPDKDSPAVIMQQRWAFEA